MIWIRGDLKPAIPIDAIVFDVDGILIDDAVSYYATIKAATRHIIGILHGRGDDHAEITDADILAFKAAGGFNDDWELTHALCGLILAHGDERPPFDRIARESAGRGLSWVRAHYFPTLPLDFDVVERVCMEYYWGSALLKENFGLSARHHHGQGFVRQERPLVPPDYFDRLERLGVAAFGIVTGRNAIELEVGLQTLGAAGDPRFRVMIDSTQARKPDPAALRAALSQLGPAHALYIGDTGDDLQLVLNYRRAAGPDDPPCLAAMLARHGQRARLEAAGADLVLDQAVELIDALAIISRMPPTHDGGASV